MWRGSLLSLSSIYFLKFLYIFFKYFLAVPCQSIPQLISKNSFIIRYTFAPYRGFVNGVLKWMGVVTTTTEPLWFNEVNLSWVVIVLMTVWWTAGFPMLLYLSALQDISGEIMEAASVDGATEMQKFFHITLPLLKPTIFLVAMLQIIACFKVFGQIRIVTGGGPANSTRSLIMYIYEQAFDKNSMGYASAMSYVLFLILVVCTLVQLKLQKEMTDYEEEDACWNHSGISCFDWPGANHDFAGLLGNILLPAV